MSHGQPKTADPTFLCRTYAAWKLLSVGKTQEAEDELAAAFGHHITRIERNGKLLAKWSFRCDLTPEQEVAMIEKIQGIVADKASEIGLTLPPLAKTAEDPKP